MKMMKWLPCLLGVLFFAVPCDAEELPLDYPNAGGWKDLQRPERVEGSLQLPEKAMLGTQISAKLVIKNAGPTAFEITTGGDYRSTGFPQRMKVRVRDAQGHDLPGLTPDSYGFGGGGILAPRTIAPGDSEAIEFPLDRYVSFPKSGTYTVLAGHDLGWQKHPDKPHPLGQSTITISEPTLEEAAALVKSIVSGRQTTPTHVAFQGKSYPPVRDEPLDYVTQAKLCVLRHPVYLSALREAAESGSAEAVSGIGHIATPEATEALIALMKNESARTVSEALQQLVRRVPDLSEKTTTGSGFKRDRDTFQIDPLLPASWKAEFQPQIAEEAVRLLRHTYPNVVSAAAAIIESCGAEVAGQALLDALQTSLDAWRNIPRHDTAALYPPMPETSLLRALDGLRKRGWRSPEPGRTALMVAKFREYADDTIPKPTDARWRDSMLTWVENGPPTLKEHALRGIPLPLSDAAIKAVLKALEDDNPRVLLAACAVAHKAALKDFIRPLCQIVVTDRIPNVNSAAVDAARQCGARLDLWRAVADNIVNKELLVHSMRTLAIGMLKLDLGNGYGGNTNFTRDQRFQMRDAWLAFLDQHHEPLASGTRLPLPDDKTTAQLTGENFSPGQPVISLQLKNGKRWPEAAKKK